VFAPDIRGRRNWALIILLISEEIDYICAGDLIMDNGSEYYEKIFTHPQLNCEKHVEGTFYKSRKFDPVCVTCGTLDELVGVYPVRLNNRQQVLFPQCNLCTNDPTMHDVAFRNLKTKSKAVSFQKRPQNRAGAPQLLPAITVEGELDASNTSAPETDDESIREREMASNDSQSDFEPASPRVTTGNAEEVLDFSVLVGAQLQVPCNTWSHEHAVANFGVDCGDKKTDAEVTKVRVLGAQATCTIRFSKLKSSFSGYNVNYVYRYATEIPASLQRHYAGYLTSAEYQSDLNADQKF
jgi:hypothetical protein